jgi:hypothetical protein
MDAAPGIALGATRIFQTKAADDRHCRGRIHAFVLAYACHDSRSLCHLFSVLRHAAPRVLVS